MESLREELNLIEIGKDYIKQKEYMQAEAAFKKIIQSNPDNCEAYFELGKVYYIQERYPDAIENLDRAINLNRENAFAHDFLSKSYNALIRLIQNYNFEGRYQEVLDEGAQARRLIPEDNIMRQNILLNEIEIAQKKIMLTSKVKSLTFTLTNKCNLRCLMCKTREETPWDLPDKTKKEFVELLPYLERVMWQGGEAFLYDGFEELLDEAARFPIRQILATNGLLINERVAEKLVRYNVELTFSIDGATKEVYEHIRPGANFEKVLRNVDLINGLRERINPEMETRLNVLIMRANYHQIEQFLDFAKKYKFNTLFFNATGCDFENLKENIFYYNYDPEVVAYINKIRDRIAKKAGELNLRLENWLPSVEFFDQVTKKDNKEGISRNNDKKLLCHAPWQRLYIDCGGGVRPDCLCLTEKPVGNLLENTLEEIWNGEGIKEYRTRIINQDYRNFCNPDCVFGRVPKKNLKFV